MQVFDVFYVALDAAQERVRCMSLYACLCECVYDERI